MFKLNNIVIDNNKENILVLGTQLYNNGHCDHFYGFLKPLIEILSLKYNVFTISNDKYDRNNHIKIDFSEIDKILKSEMVYAKDDKDFREKNKNIVKKYLNENYRFLFEYNFKYIIMKDNDLGLPLAKYKAPKEVSHLLNEFHDYTGDNNILIKEINECTKHYAEKFDNYFSFTAFSQIRKAFLLTVFEHILNHNPDAVIDTFIIDLFTFWPYLDNKSQENRSFYFVNDNTGTRNFEMFPIGLLQNYYYTKISENNKKASLSNFFDVEKLFLYYGTLAHTKGNRQFLFDKFLNDLILENSDIKVPLTLNGSGTIRNNFGGDEITDKSKTNMLKNHPHILTLLERIKNHPLYSAPIDANELIDEIKKYKYTLITCGVANNNAINFRPFLYTMLGIMFFIDENYDPNYLLIPKHIQDKIRVKNATDIMKKIEYYNKNENEKNEILHDLFYQMKIDKIHDDEYMNELILSYYK